MSTILRQQADKEIRKSRQQSSRLMKSQQSSKDLLPELRFKVKTPLSQTALGFFKERLNDGNFSMQMENTRKNMLDGVFNKLHPFYRRDLLDFAITQFETEFQKICHEHNFKELTDNYSVFQATMNKFLKSVISQYEDQVAIAKNSLDKLSEQEQLHAQLQEQYQQLSNRVCNVSTPPKHEAMHIHKNNKEAQRKQSELYMENLKLKNEVERLQERLKTIESMTSVQNLLQEIEQIKRKSQEKINELLNENQLKDKQVQKLSLHYTNIKSQFNKLENESKAYQTVFEANKAQLDKLIAQDAQNVNAMNRYREMAYMLKEEFDAKNMYVKEQLQVAQKAKEKLQALQSKLDRFQIEKSKEIEPQPNIHYEKEKTGLDRFADLFSSDKTFLRQAYAAIQQDKQKATDRIGHSVQTMETYFNSQEIQLERMTIAYCPFITLIDHHRKTLESEFNTIQFKRPSLPFLITIRQILDAKWNEFQMQMHSGFPEFVYSWLMSFQVDYPSKSVKQLNASEIKQDDQIARFVLDLSNPVLSKNWECITFQEFINDFTSQDELYFYLNARNLLFRGPQCQHKPAFYEANHYVPHLQAEFIAHHLFSQYEAITLNQLKKVIKEKSVKKLPNKQLLIVDSGFVLRIFLEYYRTERRNRYKLLKLAFGSRAQNISFKQFRIVMISNYPNITNLELATIYRQASSLEKQVSIDQIYTVAGDIGFFIKHLKIQQMTPMPKFAGDDFLYEPSQQQYVFVKECYRRFLKHKPQLSDMLVEIGLESVIAKINQFDQFYQSKFTNPHDYGSFNFAQVVSSFMHMYQQISLLLYSKLHLQDNVVQASEYQKLIEDKLKQATDKVIPLNWDNFNRKYMSRDGFGQDLELLKGQMDGLETIANYFDSLAQQKKKQEFNQGVAVRKVQKFIRKKMTKFYSFVSSLLSAKLKTSMKTK